MKTADKVVAFCATPRAAVEIAAHCKIQLSSIYSHLGRLQVKGILKRSGKEPALYVVTVPVEVVIEENLIITYAHAPFGLHL
jgi:sugar-specific transcriptional regulator TrmB